MKNAMTRGSAATLLALGLAGGGLALAGQSGPPPGAARPAAARASSTFAQPATPSRGDYAVGPGDVLSVTVQDMPEASGKFRVTGGGYLVLPGLATPLQAAGLTALGLAREIAQALKTAELLRNPVVSVFVEEYHSRTITVLGAVRKPSVYPLQRPTTVLEALSMAGGLLPTAGRHLTLVWRTPTSTSPGATATRPDARPAESVRNIDLAELLDGQDPSLNVEVEAGDVLTVSSAPLIYVVGAVQKPGGFVLSDPTASITVLQALALGGGLTPIAAASHSVIVRHAAKGSSRREIPIDLQKLMAGKVDDQALEPNDILFVPESGARRGARRLAEAAVQAATGVIIYGVGYGIVR